MKGEKKRSKFTAFVICPLEYSWKDLASIKIRLGSSIIFSSSAVEINTDLYSVDTVKIFTKINLS